MSRVDDMLRSDPAAGFLEQVASRWSASDSPLGSSLAETAYTMVDGWYFWPPRPAVDRSARLLATAEWLVSLPQIQWWWHEGPAAQQCAPDYLEASTSPARYTRDGSNWEALPGGPTSFPDDVQTSAFVESIFQKLHSGSTRRTTAHYKLLANPRVAQILSRQDWIDICRRWGHQIPIGEKLYWREFLGSRSEVSLPLDQVYIPHWASLAEDFDAVYLSPSGYLSCESNPIVDNDRVYFMVGWEPTMLLWLRPPVGLWLSEAGSDGPRPLAEDDWPPGVRPDRPR